MKKLGVLGLAVFLLVASASLSFGMEIKAKGYWWIEAQLKQGWDFLGKGAISEDKTFNLEQKMRTQFTFIANENLRGVLDTQIGSGNWGNGLFGIGAGRSAATSASANANNAGSGNIMLRKAYIEYRWPNTMTNISLGFQTVTLPAAFGGGSAILDDQVAAAVVSAPITDNVSILAGYARPYDANSSVSTAGGSLSGAGTAADVVFAALPLTFKGLNITPFAAYASLGSQANGGTGVTTLAGLASANSTAGEGARAYWGGVAATVTMLDNFKFMGDFNYGKATFNKMNTPNVGSSSRSGFLFDVAVDYTGLSMMTPELFFTYSSGENGNSSKGGSSERMPVLGTPQNWTIGSFFFGERLELGGSINNTAGYTSNTLGYWALGLSLKDIKVFDKLTHDFNLLYAKGTNNKDYLYEAGGTVRNANYAGFLTTKDSLWEVDFNSRYKIYDELSLLVYTGYIHANFDKDVWGASSVTNAADIQNYKSSNAYKLGVGLNYFF
jgi:hypothetical protein